MVRQSIIHLNPLPNKLWHHVKMMTNIVTMMALDDLNKTVSRQLVLGTFLDLVQLYDENNYSCHHEGHHLGMWLYDYTRNLKEALNYATVLCGGSVYHGIFQSYFGGEQFVHNVDKNQIMITHLCPVGQENVTWLHERDCIHGIGHGLVKLYNYNTTAAVDRCNEFIPLWAQSACSRGVFMENNEYFFETGKGDFDKNDIYSPCDRTTEKFAPQCYYQRVVGQLGIERVRARERAVDQDRVAVGRRLRHHVGADRAAGAGAVLDDDILSELPADLLHHDARDDVARTARTERHDHGDVARRPVLRGGGSGEGGKRKERGQNGARKDGRKFMALP